MYSPINKKITIYQRIICFNDQSTDLHFFFQMEAYKIPHKVVESLFFKKLIFSSSVNSNKKFSVLQERHFFKKIIYSKVTRISLGTLEKPPGVSEKYLFIVFFL